MINCVNESGRELKEYIIYVTDFLGFERRFLAAAILRNILSSFLSVSLTFQFSQLPSTRELKLDKILILVQHIHN